MAPDEDEFDDDDGERFSDLVQDETLDFEDTETDGASSHSESVYVVDDEEAGRESYARSTTATLELIAEQVAFQDDVVEETLDADPNALDAAIAEPAEAPRDDVARRHLRGLLEALLFVSERPMKAADLADIARADTKDVRSILEELSEQYRSEARGFQLDELAGGWQLRTSAAYAPFVRELTQAKPVKLSRAQVETLAIIAYRQPITRPEIEDIRGVDAGAVLKLLLDRDMIRVLGKKDEPGRPLLYGTTGHFLTFFGLKSLKDLPTLREFTELTEESREVVERELGEVLPEGPREPPPNVVGDASISAPDEMIHAGEPAEHGTPEELKTDEEAAEELRTAEAPVDVDDEIERAELETAAANDTENPERERGDIEEAEEDDDEAEEEPAAEEASPGGSNYDPSDEELYPDDDDDDFDDDDEDEDDEDEDEEDEDE